MKLTIRPFSSLLPFFGLLSACGTASESDDLSTESGGSSNETASGGAASTGGGSSGGSPSGGQSAMGSGGVTSAGGTNGSDGGTDSMGNGGIQSGGSASGGADNTGGTTAGGAGSGGQAAGGTGGEPNWEELAHELDEFFMHDACTGVQQAQDDTCTHEQLIEQSLTFGGDPDTEYLVTLRIRGLFEPTNISGGEAPLDDHPYFVVGGNVQAADYSQWQIEVMEPSALYYLNHYPQTSHTIYQEDFEAQIPVVGGSQIVVRVEDANDRQIDNGTPNLPDRQQLIDGVTDEVLDGQMIRLDVVSVEVTE